MSKIVREITSRSSIQEYGNRAGRERGKGRQIVNGGQGYGEGEWELSIPKGH